MIGAILAYNRRKCRRLGREVTFFTCYGVRSAAADLTHRENLIPFRIYVALLHLVVHFFLFLFSFFHTVTHRITGFDDLQRGACIRELAASLVANDK